jgi:chemotaxis protein MotB
MNARWLLSGLAAGLALVTLAGCNPTKEKAQAEEVQRLNTIVLNYEKENRDLMTQVEAAEVKLKQAEIALSGKNQQIKALQNGMTTLRRNVRLSDKVQEQLRRLAETFGGRLIGNRLELPGDFFFGSGEFDLREESRAALRKLTKILLDAEGDKVTLLIVGHTDSDPVRHAKSKGIHDNRHLSVMRSLAVLNELQKDGYPEKLMYPTGWGELYPIDSGGSKHGKAVNRRVDILIDPAASGLFGFTEITDVGPAAGPAGEKEKGAAPAEGAIEAAPAGKEEGPIEKEEAPTGKGD